MSAMAIPLTREGLLLQRAWKSTLVRSCYGFAKGIRPLADVAEFVARYHGLSLIFMPSVGNQEHGQVTPKHTGAFFASLL